jgi:lipid II:glycine glycyltransferase (peptidoglycan interpeptide bridge formation enzyme)
MALRRDPPSHDGGDVHRGSRAVSALLRVHSVDLTPFSRASTKTPTQRKIRRAQREKLTYEEGTSRTLLETFYRLLVRTRRRHESPPPALTWFENLVDCLGDSVSVKIRVASEGGRPLASILTLAFRDLLLYKYGCSDERFQNLGAVHLLFWNAMQDGKASGAREFDLGRSDCDNPGLIVFKDRWGAMRAPLTYWRYQGGVRPAREAGWGASLARKILARAPTTVLVAAGNVFYRHFG